MTPAPMICPKLVAASRAGKLKPVISDKAGIPGPTFGYLTVALARKIASTLQANIINPIEGVQSGVLAAIASIVVNK
jgi:hypothetical protein